MLTVSYWDDYHWLIKYACFDFKDVFDNCLKVMPQPRRLHRFLWQHGEQMTHAGNSTGLSLPEVKSKLQLALTSNPQILLYASKFKAVGKCLASLPGPPPPTLSLVEWRAWKSQRVAGVVGWVRSHIIYVTLHYIALCSFHRLCNLH